DRQRCFDGSGRRAGTARRRRKSRGGRRRRLRDPRPALVVDTGMGPRSG
ncbi:MAG: hypothetical protein AVDCRST_MAG88-2283, partial [uncultured Thermomicrobiales bacterium]